MFVCGTFGFLVGCFRFAQGLRREFPLLFLAYYGLQLHTLVKTVQVSFVFDVFPDVVLHVALKTHLVGATVNAPEKLSPIGFFSAQDTLL